jgi:hypothetical protein
MDGYPVLVEHRADGDRDNHQDGLGTEYHRRQTSRSAASGDVCGRHRSGRSHVTTEDTGPVPGSHGGLGAVCGS